MNSTLQIPTKDFNKIIKAIGYPAVKLEDIEFSKEEIIELIVEPIVENYYIWFPLRLKKSYNVGEGEYTFDFPNKDTFGVEDIRFRPGINSHGKTDSPFVNSMNYKINHYNQYGTRFDYGVEAASYLEESYDRTKVNNLRGVAFDIDKNARKVTVRTNDIGEVIITWSQLSYDFNNIPFDRKIEVIELCQAELLRSVAMIRNQIDDGSGVTLNTDDFISRADALEEKVRTHWKAISKVVVLRN